MEQALDRLDGSSVRAGRDLQGTAKATDEVGSAVRRNDASINQLTGRLRVLSEIAASIGPALIPVGAVSVPALSGLAASLGFAAVAGGTLVAAFQGVGDALEAVNKAALEPTEENLEAARKAMADLSPQARQLVGELRSWIPALKELRDTAAAGLFPGLTEGLDGLEKALPRVERILEAVSTELGSIAADVGESLGGERWAEFLDFIATDTPPALRDMATATGNIAHAMGELWMAFDPLNDDFLDWVVKSTDKLDDWAAGLSQTEGFEDFVDYIRTNGPQVADTMGAIATAVVDILEAAAPLGGPALKAIEGIAKGVSAVADSDMGTPILTAIAAVSALNLLLRTTGGLAAAATSPFAATAFVGGVGGRGGKGGKHIAPVGGGSDGRDRKPGRRGSSSGGGPGLESVAWVLGTAAGLDYVGNKLSEVGDKGREAEKMLRDFAAPKSDPLNKFFFGDSKHTLQRDLDRLLDANRFGGFFSSIEEDIGRALGGTTFTKSIDNVSSLDDRLTALSKSNPAGAMDAYYTAARRSGLTTEELAEALPKATRALKGQAEATGDVGSLLRQTIPQLGRYDTILRGFPSEAITEIAAEGIPETRRGIVDLTARYNLTPKQVRTLIREQGGTPTKAMIERIIATAKDLDRQRPKPKVGAKDDATGVLRNVLGLLQSVDGFTAVSTIRTVRIEERRSVASGTNAFTSGVGGGGPNSALGNIFLPEWYALGGVNDVADSHQPELYRGSRTRVWGEPETQGEAYIPLANDHRRPRARGLVEQTAELLGGIAYFADGGLDRRRPRPKKTAGTPGVTNIVFPDPVISESAAEAAERIAAAAQLTVRTTREQRAADLEVLQARQRLEQIAKSLSERETKTVKGKDGKDDDKRKKGMQDKTKTVSYLALRGIDRDVAIAELAEAKLALTDLRERRSETDAILDKIREEREAAIEKRRSDAETAISALNDSRTSFRDSLYGTVDLFGRGSTGSSGQAAVTKAIAQIGLFGQVVARLRNAGASSALLLQVVNRGRQGDFKSAIKFGQSLLAEPALISDLNGSLGALDAVSSNVATLTSDSRITGISLPGTTTVNERAINVDVRALDISQVSGEIARIVSHQVDAAIAQLQIR